jgi:hypothetical protein
MTTRSQRANEVGLNGEQAVKELLEKRGWKVEWGEVGGPDLIVEESVTVEVKTATPSGRTDRNSKRWQFLLYKNDGESSPFKEDLLVLRCETDPPVHFLIPGCLIHYRLTKIDITSKNPLRYNGRWSEFRDAWELADLVISGYLWIENPP